MAKARKASKTQSKLMTIIYGEPFTGKSTLASQIAYFKRPDGKPFRVLYLDPESGSIDDYLEDMENNGVNLDNIYIVYTQSLGEVREYIAKVKNGEDLFELDEDGNETENIVIDADGEPFRADAIVVDGTTILNLTTKQGLIEFSKKRNAVKAKKDNLIGEEKLVKIEGAGLELKDYQTINFKGQDLVLDCMASGAHCILTARETDEKITIKDGDKTTSISTGRKIPDGFKGMDYNAKTVIRTFFNEDNVVCAEIIKDRTGVHTKGEIIEDPTFLDYQQVIDKTANNKEFVLKNDLTKAVSVEQDIYKKEILGSVGSPINSSEVVENTTSENNSNEVDEIKEKLSSIAKTLNTNPVKKNQVKENLKNAGLPSGFSKITDINTLKAIYKIMSVEV